MNGLEDEMVDLAMEEGIETVGFTDCEEFEH